MPLSDRLRNPAAPLSPKGAPVWKGPEEDGITQSLLGRFLACRERFRLLVVEGLKPRDNFSHRLHYGLMWHVCEEQLAAGPHGKDGMGWGPPLCDYCNDLCTQYPLAREQIEHWYNVCRVQFPLYADYWTASTQSASRNQQPDKANRTPLLQEQVFDVPYALPSGRTVRLRGKWDSVDLVEGNKGGIWLFETKTKGDVNPSQIQRQLTFDLQTMLYLVAMSEPRGYDQYLRDRLGAPARLNILPTGVRYNVVKRPLSGGKGSIVRHKATKFKPEESKESFYGRLADIIRETPADFFMRWDVQVTPQDIERFKREFLNPILEQLCDWWAWVVSRDGTARGDRVSMDLFSDPNGIHWRHPFGVYNPMDEGGSSELDAYLDTGSEVGLCRTDNLFPEL